VVGGWWLVVGYSANVILSEPQAIEGSALPMVHRPKWIPDPSSAAALWLSAREPGLYSGNNAIHDCRKRRLSSDRR
jgi:hypothetical protein